MARQPDNKSADKSAANLKSDDSALIRELALLLDETSLTEIEIERAGLRVRVARNVTVSAAMPAGFQPAPAAAAVPAAGADLAKHPGAVPSPMVGTGSGGGCRGSNRRRLEARRHRRRYGDVARDPHPQTGALDFDLGQAGLIQQQREFANERAVVALQVCG